MNMQQQTLNTRLVNLKNERSILMRDYGMLRDIDRPFPTADNEGVFSNVDDLSYYERLTGHIEEVQDLIKVLA